MACPSFSAPNNLYLVAFWGSFGRARRGLTAGRLAGWGRRASPGLPRLPAGPTMALAMVLAVPTARPPAALRGTELDPALTSSRASPSPSPLPLSSPSPTLQSWALYSHECPAGQRRAAHSECLAAVTEAAWSAGVEVRGGKNADDSLAAAVPPRCSYSTLSKMAIFNSNPAGQPVPWHHSSLRPAGVLLKIAILLTVLYEQP